MNPRDIKRPRAVLFDHDGVLVASEPLHWEAWRLLCGELELPYDDLEIRHLAGKTAPQVLAFLLDRYRPGWNPDDYDLNALARRKNDFYLAEAKTRLQPYPGVRELLQWLRAEGIRTAVVSNARKRELFAALENLGLAPLFDAITSREDSGKAKPDPTPYLYGAATIGVDPAECLAVEDSPPGLEAALMANIPVAAVLTNFPSEVLEAPVPGRPDLQPTWIGLDIPALMSWLQGLPQI